MSTADTTDAGSVGLVETKSIVLDETRDGFTLESGAKIGPVTVAYESYGTLSEEKDNVILVCHALSGDAHAAGRHHEDDRKPGWWDGMIGPGKGIDTDKYFVICSNFLGGCKGTTGPTSHNPATGKAYNLDFPIFTVGDMVRVQHALIRQLGIEQLLCVLGGSLGGMQALEWSTRYPDDTRSVILLATSHYTGAQQIAFDAVGRSAIQADPEFHGGEYNPVRGPRKGLAIARMLAHITYLSDQSMDRKFGRTLHHAGSLGYRFGSEFNVETYLDYQGERFVNRFDANTYLYVTKAMDYFDMSAGFDSLDASLARVKPRTLAISFTSDWLFPPYMSQDIVYALARNRKEVAYCNIKTDAGHDAFLLELKDISRLISGFLIHTLYPERECENCPPKSCDNPDQPQPIKNDHLGKLKRVDYEMIVNLVEENSRVLDAGCGEGELLCSLQRRKNIVGVGIELDQEKVIRAIGCGIHVIQANLDKGLVELPDDSFDYVVLSMTLQVVKNPALALKEMLRVGKKCIVTFPNFGHWRVRANLAFKGRAPVTPNLPYSWYDSPNRHVLTIKDFREFCRKLDIAIEKEIVLNADGQTSFMPNLFAEEAVYVLKKN
ncbi:MAG: homoserine O-acetyltransferase [Candidatus Hydrogenedens sp.]|jgi:homoserine O-acetyltransferase|nr:homoserine O-acetyltransferase [Candidatus Hydrogenedens sp.]